MAHVHLGTLFPNLCYAGLSMPLSMQLPDEAYSSCISIYVHTTDTIYMQDNEYSMLLMLGHVFH